MEENELDNSQKNEGVYIDFINNSLPAINATNLNGLQQLIKQDIEDKASATGTILFESQQGSYEDITLTDNAENYDYLEIYAHFSENRTYVKLNNLNDLQYSDKRFALVFYKINGNDSTQFIYVQNNTISNNTITRLKPINIQMTSARFTITIPNEQKFLIDKVIGYK